MASLCNESRRRGLKSALTKFAEIVLSKHTLYCGALGTECAEDLKMSGVAILPDMQYPYHSGTYQGLILDMINFATQNPICSKMFPRPEINNDVIRNSRSEWNKGGRKCEAGDTMVHLDFAQRPQFKWIMSFMGLDRTFTLPPFFPMSFSP